MNPLRIKTTGEINTRTQDGREFTASEGSTVEIDGDDPAMVGLAKSLILSGQAVHYGDAGEVDEEVTEVDSEPEPVPDAEKDLEVLEEPDEDDEA